LLAFLGIMLAKCRMRAQFEDVRWTEHESFLARAYDLPRFAVPWHFHPEMELTLILEGGGDRCVGDHLESFEAGDLVLLGPNLPHYWHSHAPREGAARGRGRARAIVVQLREESFGKRFFSLPETASWLRLLECARRGLAFPATVAETVAREMRDMLKLEGTRRLLAMLGILQRLSDALPQARALASEHYMADCDHRTAGRVRKVYQFIYAHLGEPVGLNDVARVAGMSAAAFSRYCRRVTGRTLTRLLAELRVTQACKLLTDTDQSVSEIAFASGFQSISNFNRVFHDLKGESPMSFRRARRSSA
jgi:AraC-like DNA-binding protein